MSADLLVGLVVGAVLTAVVAALVHRRREAAAHGLIDREAPGRDGPEPRRSAADRAGRALTRQARDLEAADQARARLEQALDRMVDGVVVCDLEGRVVFTNTAGSVVATARHEDALVAAAVTDGLRKAVVDGHATQSVELFGPPARTVTVEAHLLRRGEQALGAVAAITDQSRVRRLEAVRSDFVANVSHELKTPIGGLALLAEALADAIDAEERERLAGRLHDEAHRVGRVIDDLLVLSEVEGDLSPDRIPCDVAGLVERAMGEVATLSDGFGVEITTDGVDAGLVVLGDPIQLGSAITNLVENAVKYGGDTAPVEIWAHRDGDQVRLGVTDHGPGIPSRDLDRIFERFYRVDRARSRATGGTGLGLAIVRNVARRHGGDVAVRSREGQGSTFVLTLPRLSPSELGPADDVGAPRADAHASNGGGS